MGLMICIVDKIGVFGSVVFVMGCVVCFLVFVSFGVVIGLGFLS